MDSRMSDAWKPYREVRDGPAGAEMDRYVAAALRSWVEERVLPYDGRPTPPSKRYSRRCDAAWTALRDFWGNDLRTNINLSWTNGIYRCEAKGETKGALRDRWICWGEGETLPLAICRMLLHVREPRP